MIEMTYDDVLPALTDAQRATMSEDDQLEHFKRRFKSIRQWIRSEKRRAKGLPEIVDSRLTLENLIAIESRIPRPAKLPKSLHIDDIHVAQSVFQFRIPGSDTLESERQIKSLTDAINDEVKGSGRKMTPILVIMVGDTAFVVDGHHRLTAYMRSKWQKKIPVDYFPRSVIDARAHALIANVPGKLGLNTASKSEAAWKLVQENNHSKAEIARLSGRSERLVALMRSRLSGDDTLRGLPWAEAISDRSKSIKPGDSAYQKQVADAAKRWIRNGGSKFPYSPPFMAAVLAHIDPELPQKLCQQWSVESRLVSKALETSEFGGLDI